MSTQDNSTFQPLVMIIDDDAMARMQATEFMTQAGFRVAEAENGDSALLCIEDIAPDLILLDVEMPGINGFDLCKVLREKPQFAVTPILMLTGLENNEAINRAYDAGATDFATKPINWSLLSHRLRYMHRGSLAAEQLKREQSNLAAAQRIAQLGNWQYDTKSKQTEWSDQMFHMIGLPVSDNYPSLETMLEIVHPDDRKKVTEWLQKTSTDKNPSSVDHRIVLSSGEVRCVSQQIEPEFNSDGQLIRLRATVQDFTERKEVENRVRKLAYYDTLTDLPNRLLFQENLSNTLNRSKNHQPEPAILYFDLDDFKRINDTFGHVIGDKLLQETGKRLRRIFSMHEDSELDDYQLHTIARMGGDEFAVILNKINEDQIVKIAQDIIDALVEPFCFDGYALFTSPSIGIALNPDGGSCAETLLKNADMAMYEAKRSGKSAFRIHNQDMDEKAQKHYELDVQMRTALERNEFSLHYQPQLDLETGELYSAEALLRWNNETLGFVSPADFIPVAEDNGLIVPIGRWVLETACIQATKWIKSGFPIPSIAVNISALQFMRVDFPDIVKSVLAETGLPAEHLELEITESVLASDTNHAVNTLKKLSDIGVMLSIDDFGTGYSSLSQLKNFPIHRLKIDQSFIKNITENTDDAAITRAVIAMSKTMNIKVIAEGVETAEHLQFLRDNACDEVQGYFISRPMTAELIEEGMPELLATLADIFKLDDNNNIKLVS